jgi:NTP pyrophosphatase (non-canonical NTP hydrolase)
MRAYRILSRLSHGEDGDWNDLRRQGRKFARESGELANAIEHGRLESPDDLGRLFTRLVNIARLKGYRAEDILHDFLRKLE